MISISEPSEKINNVVDNLFISTRKEQVEDVFFRNSIEDRVERIRLLRKCMHVLDTSNADNSISLDDEYNDELAIFLNGKWRMLV